MKTDPFDDAIRRKLEGVNPPYQEKSWTQFQRFMGSQGFPPSIWQTPTRWLQPALMAAAVTGVIITTIWQYRTTQSLTQHVQRLTKTVERMEQTQMRLQQSVAEMASASTRPDTVYLTQPPRSGSLAVRDADARPAPTENYSSASPRQQLTDEPVSAPSERVASARRVRTGQNTTPQSVDSRENNQVSSQSGQLVKEQADQATNRTTTGQPQSANDQFMTGQPQSAADRLAAGRPSSSATPTAKEQPRYAADPAGSVPIPPESGRGQAITRQAGRTGTLPPQDQSANYQSTNSTTRILRSNDPTLYSPSVTNQVNSAESTAVKPTITATGPLATVQPLASLTLPDPATAFAESWQRHLRRVRYRSPYMTSMSSTVAATEPASPEKHTTPLPIQFRLGVGGDIGTAQSGPGIYAEAVLANKLTISTGVSQTYWQGDEYPTEQMFTTKTKRDFHRDYPGSAKTVPIGPGRPPKVMNIHRAAQSIVVPVQVGYRFSMGGHYVLIPSVGLNLSITPRETVTFQYDPLMYRDEIQKSVSVDRPAGWYSSMTFGVGAERQWGRFAGQLGSVALVPVQESAASLNSLSIGLRGRVFYQF